MNKKGKIDGKVWSSFKEPLLDSMPDSFKKWVPVWENVLENDLKYRINGTTAYLDSAKEQNKLDSINQGIVTEFLDKYGFPTRHQSGIKGYNAIFMVMQHSPVSTQEKYYPLMVGGYKNNNLYGLGLALLEDRINMYRHRKQYYGTQHMRYDDGEDYLYPVVNPDSINAWRKQIDINNTIEEAYKDIYKKEWDIEQYKKDLPDLIKKFKVTDSPGIRFVK